MHKILFFQLLFVFAALSPGVMPAAAAGTGKTTVQNEEQASETTVSPDSIDNDDTDTDDDAESEEGKGAKLSVILNGLSDKVMHDNAKAFLDIDKESGKAVKSPSYTQFLATAGIEQIQQALQPFGYYLTAVEMDSKVSADTWQVTYNVTPGVPVKVAKVDVLIEGEGKHQREFKKLLANYPLKVGDVLLQEKYTAFKNDVLAQAVTDGYFDGKFTRKQIVLSDDLKSADILVTYDTGKRYVFGQTTFKQDFLDDDVFQRFVAYEPGEVYSSTSVANVQRDLYNSNYVKMIDIDSTPVTADKNVPVVFTLTPKKNKKHMFAIGYGTDTGVRAKYEFDWRWVNRRGHQLIANAFASQIEQSAGVEYRIPADKPATDYYKLFANVDRKKDDDTDSLLWNLGGAYHDQQGNWQREFGIKWQQEDFTLGDDSGNIGLLTPYAKMTYRKADDFLNISRGLMLSGELTGAHDALLSDVSFLQAVARAKVVRKFGEVNKVTLSAAVGRTWVDDFHQLPAAYRFFTGGDKTVRGYKFEDIGDRDAGNTNIGGDKMYYISAEYEYFFRDSMAAAVFVDAGDAYSSDSATLKVGAGVGFHYYSPVGPIRIDIAHGFDEPGDDVRLHLNIGPEL